MQSTGSKTAIQSNISTRHTKILQVKNLYLMHTDQIKKGKHSIVLGSSIDKNCRIDEFSVLQVENRKEHHSRKILAKVVRSQLLLDR